MNGNPIVIRRGRVAQLASFIGIAALIIGVIGFIWQGELTTYVGAVFVLAILGIAAWAVLTPQEFVGFITGRQMRHSTGAIFGTMLLVGITVVVYLLLQRAALTLDMTLANRFTLSSETNSVLQHVTRRMRITGFYSPKSLSTRQVDDEFFRLYTTATNGLIERLYIDPDEQPALAQRYGVIEDAMVFLSYVNADGSTDLTSLARVPRSSNQERDMTQAVSRELIAGTLTVYFDTGLGERSPEDTTQEGISGIRAGVQESGLVAYPLDISALASSGADIPHDAAAVVFARPTRDLTAAEIDVIDRYLNTGGSLLLLPDVLFNDDPFLKQSGAFNQYLWDNYGIQALDAAVVDPSMSGQTALDVMSAYIFPETDIGARLDPNTNPTVFSLARALDVNLDSSPPNVANGRVIMSSEQSFGETDLKTLGETNSYHYDTGVDLPGPLTTVVWASNQQTKAKIVMVGDSNFVSNGLVLSGGNGVLFTDSMAWLTGLGEKISFAPQAYGVGTPLIYVSTQTLDLIAFLTIILLPGAVLASGVAIWMRRTRR